MRPHRYARRRVVVGTAAALAGVAGCSGAGEATGENERASMADRTC